MGTTNGWHMRVAGLSRSSKRAIMVLADLIALPLALWSAYALRFAEWWPEKQMAPFWWLFLVLPPMGVFVFARLGLYRAVVRFMGPQALWAVVKGVLLLALFMWAAAYYFHQFQGFPRSVPINFILVALIYVGGTRFLVSSYYRWLVRHYSKKEAVAIYGAGGAGVQLATALANSREFFAAAFIDDDLTLRGSTILGIKVHGPWEAGELVRNLRIRRVLLALPTASKRQRKLALESLEGFPVHVQTVPSMPEIVSGEASVDQFREVDLDDLLGRDSVPPNKELMDANIAGKVVMVTGAGGSIGSELCRQILRCDPRMLLLLEQSEIALYNIEAELRAAMFAEQIQVSIVPLLGSVTHERRLLDAMRSFAVDTVYHAAAYKHVPIVEQNVLEGVHNNIIGTWRTARSAMEAGVSAFVLISTDKAVRPTNVMGATKRFAELVLQALAADANSKTCFSMVRFGNVLGSSGSVVPLFREQISQGGPVTVTHKDITRYFMTIPEAAALVIQAGSMGKGGDVFVLDMGQPMKIHAMARRMIHLSGFEVKDHKNPAGEIEIRFTGLRPGEKLYEELLLGDNVTGTAHPMIMRAQEDRFTLDEIQDMLQTLGLANRDSDCDAALAVLKHAVSGFTPSGASNDLLWRCGDKAHAGQAPGSAVLPPGDKRLRSH